MGAFDIIRNSFRAGAAATAAVTRHADEAAEAVAAGRTAAAIPTNIGETIATARLDMHAQLSIRTEIHLARNRLMAKADALRSLGSMLEAVARQDGIASVAPHQLRYDRIQRDVVELLQAHDALLTKSGYELDDTVRATVELVSSTRDPAKVVALRLPTGETALEARINQLIGDGPALRRPVIDASEAMPSPALRISSADTPQHTVDRYRALVGDAGGSRGPTVPAADDALPDGRTLPQVSDSTGLRRTLPDTSDGRPAIGLPTIERQAQAAGPTPIGRSNGALDFLNRNLADDIPEEVTDATMRKRVQELRANPDAAQGFQGISFDVGEDDAGVVRRRI